MHVHLVLGVVNMQQVFDHTVHQHRLNVLHSKMKERICNIHRICREANVSSSERTFRKCEVRNMPYRLLQQAETHTHKHTPLYPCYVDRLVYVDYLSSWQDYSSVYRCYHVHDLPPEAWKVCINHCCCSCCHTLHCRVQLRLYIRHVILPCQVCRVVMQESTACRCSNLQQSCVCQVRAEEADINEQREGMQLLLTPCTSTPGRYDEKQCKIMLACCAYYICLKCISSL